MSDDFVIAKVAWHTRVVGNPETREHLVRRFWAVTKFLRDNGLLTRALAEKPDEIDDEYCIRRSDLTPEGWELIRAAYDRWLKRVDRGTPPENTSILEKALRKLRQGRSE